MEKGEGEMSNKVKMLAGVMAAVVLGLGVVGGTVLAQGTGEGGPSPGGPLTQNGDGGGPFADGLCARFLEGVASHLDATVEEVEGAFKATKLDMLDEAVEAGKIDPEKAEQIAERIEEGSPCWHPHPRQQQQGPRLLKKLVIHAAAETLGMTPPELVGELRECKSLVQVAAEQGVEREVLKSGILNEAAERLEQAVANGRITQEQADRVLQGLTDRIDDIVDRVHCPEAPPET